VAALAVMPARVLALRNALLLLKAPATELERSVLRTAVDLTFAFRFVVRGVLRFAWVLRLELTTAARLTEVFGVLWTTEVLLRRTVVRVVALLILPRLALAWKLRADERDIAGPAPRDTAGRALK